MQATTASYNRSKKGLTLNEKIFELHEAVRILQFKDSKKQKSQKKENIYETTEALSQKVDGMENKCGVLRQALETMADAVAEEIDEIR